jgi:hypothetical protein
MELINKNIEQQTRRVVEDWRIFASSSSSFGRCCWSIAFEIITWKKGATCFCRSLNEIASRNSFSHFSLS